MLRSYKNFWSLNTDEAVVTGFLRAAIGKKNGDVLMPLNAQMKDVDLFVINTKTKEVKTVQVKGSRTYEPRQAEANAHGEGSGGWFSLKKEVVENATADYFIFIMYVLTQSYESGRRTLNPHVLVIPTGELKKQSFGKSHYYNFWINPKTKTAQRFKEANWDVSQYLDDKGLKLLCNDIGIV